jgi:hypothetical protein
MAIHVLVADPNAIDFGHAGLKARVEAYLERPVSMYRPLTFVEHSGFSETVREEISMVLANHAPDEVPARQFDAFVRDWDLGMHLERRVLALSGGWRKYLGLALFMNRPLTARLLLDTTSHLSDARLRTLLTRAAESPDAVFCEYDPELLLRLDPSIALLSDDGSTIRAMS